jgi:hypothetical protein
LPPRPKSQADFRVSLDGGRRPPLLGSPHGLRGRARSRAVGANARRAISGPWLSFGDKVVTDITPGREQHYRVHRMTSRKDPKTQKPLLDTGEPFAGPSVNRVLKDPKTGDAKRPSRTTLHHEIITFGMC